jgi:DNA-binding transcriptional regulator YiaG
MKPIEGIPGYEITEDGKIWSIRGKRFLNTSHGYVTVWLRGKYYQVHRLVAKAYIPQPTGRNIVNHKNSNKADNRAENLEWVTESENAYHSVTHGRHITRGEEHPNAHFTEDDVRKVREMYSSGMTQYKIAEVFGIDQGTVSNIVNRKRWAHVV